MTIPIIGAPTLLDQPDVRYVSMTVVFGCTCSDATRMTVLVIEGHTSAGVTCKKCGRNWQLMGGVMQPNGECQVLVNPVIVPKPEL